MARTAPLPIRRTYNELDRWRAYNHYITTGQFTKTTAKACFIAVSTMRSWVKAWDFDADGQARNPPNQPTQDELAEITESGDLIAEYEDLLKMALSRLREVIPKTNSADQLGRVVKDMADRIDRAKGITGGEVPSTVNVNLRLADAREAGAGLIEQIRRNLADATERSEHIIDAEVIEPPQIEASHSEDGSTDDA